MSFPDYSEYLKRPGILAWIEKEWKTKPDMHEYHAKIVNEAIEKYNAQSVIEIGCGTGEVAVRLNKCRYSGYDANEDCVKIAKTKKPYWLFSVADVRALEIKDRADIVFCFGFLKHFGLHEWSDIFKKVSSFGKYFIFDMPIGETKDDGVDYHHVWKSLDEIQNDIKSAGLVLLSIINPSSIEPVFITKNK